MRSMSQVSMRSTCSRAPARSRIITRSSQVAPGCRCASSSAATRVSRDGCVARLKTASQQRSDRDARWKKTTSFSRLRAAKNTWSSSPCQSGSGSSPSTRSQRRSARFFSSPGQAQSSASGQACFHSPAHRWWKRLGETINRGAPSPSTKARVSPSSGPGECTKRPPLASRTTVVRVPVSTPRKRSGRAWVQRSSARRSTPWTVPPPRGRRLRLQRGWGDRRATRWRRS